MFLRSHSTPIQHSWFPHSRDSPSESESYIQIPKTGSVFTRTLSSVSNSTTPLSESDLNIPKRTDNPKTEEREDDPISVDSLNALFFSNSGLDKSGYTRNRGFLKVAVDGGTGGRGTGGKIGVRGGGGRKSDGDDDDDDGVSSDWESNHENSISDGYYQKIIDANPGNPLLLSNYAIFLKEVHGDLKKAEEYCERAILEDPNDGNTLSFYANLIWDIQKNVNRADNYFNRAIKASPNDCNVMASYARFLWDVDDEEEDGKYEKENDDDDDDEDKQDANSSPNSQIQENV